MSVYSHKPDRYSSHSRILNMIRPSDKVILDVGCASGYLAKELGKSHMVYGIETDKADAEKAKKHCNHVIVGDVESLKFPYNQSFDVMVFGDVLEHLKDPVKTLQSFKPYLKDKGRIICSTSNIGNWYARLNMLLGRFPQQDRGLFDRTHLHFWTRKTFRDVFQQAGFRIIDEDVTPIP
ncbi:MAG: class I SAM-dependent methyltransferase, partial [Nanoarchaeota archaeon]|nr:class I SAM-dependent methyltransferase [Nanoarchaeota archaeon]